MTTQALDGLVVLRPSGDLCEGAECDELERTLLGLVEAGRRVVVDLAGTRLLTARALGILARARGVAASHGGRLVVCNANRLQRWLLGMTRLTEGVDIFEDLALATRALAVNRRAVA